MKSVSIGATSLARSMQFLQPPSAESQILDDFYNLSQVQSQDLPPINRARNKKACRNAGFLRACTSLTLTFNGGALRRFHFLGGNGCPNRIHDVSQPSLLSELAVPLCARHPKAEIPLFPKTLSREQRARAQFSMGRLFTFTCLTHVR